MTKKPPLPLDKSKVAKALNARAVCAGCRLYAKARAVGVALNHEPCMNADCGCACQDRMRVN